MTKSIQVFVSYSHRDAFWLERLQVHLKPLERGGAISLWDDTRLRPGARWHDEVIQALTSAKVAVLLVSADFLASKFIVENELPPLLAAAQKSGVKIFPVIVGPCLYEASPLEPFQAVNDLKEPLIGLPVASQEKTMVKLAEAIIDEVKSFQSNP